MMTAASRGTGCIYCPQSRFTRSNYGSTYRIDIGNRWVHYGCLIHWLIDDAITRNFPGISTRERDVLKYRIAAPEAYGPRISDLSTVGHRMRWTGSVRASQVQIDAIGKFRPESAEVAKQDAARWAAAQPVIAQVQGLLTEAEEALASLGGSE